MTFFVQPHFTWPRRRGIVGDWLQNVVLTDTGATFYNEQLNSTALAMGQMVGFLRPVEDDTSSVEVYHPSGSFMGVTDNKMKAAEELVRIYAQQADSLNR